MTSSEASCQKGHSWNQSDASRKAGQGCPYCANQKILIGFNDLESQFPEIADQWDQERNQVSPTEVTRKSTKKAFWLCDKGHSWEAQISSRTQQGTGCPFCAGRKILSGYNDFATLAPPHLKEWHPTKNLPLTPDQVGPSVAKSVWWLCTKGHEFEQNLHDRARGSGCPFCAGKKVLAGFNDFQTHHPEGAKFWDEIKNGFAANAVVKGSTKKFWFRCPDGHSFQSSPNDMARSADKNSGCKICAGKVCLPGFNDLVTKLPEVAKLWHPTKNFQLTPSEVTRASTKRVWWQCPADEKHEWFDTVASRSQGQGCPICTSRYVVAGINDLATVAPEIASEWNYEKNSGRGPTDVSATTPRKAWWRCSQDARHEWQANIESRVRGGRGCPICSNKKTVAGINDLATTHPFLAAEWNAEKNVKAPDQVNAGDHKNYWWLCSKCESVWRAAPINRSRVNSGCPKCAKSGYDPTSEGFLYLLSRDSEMLQQFGITNVPKKRLATHKLNGWEVLDVIGPLDGYWVVDTESALKDFFTAKGLRLERGAVPAFDGYTESWRSDRLRFEKISELLEALRDWEWTYRDS